MSDEEPSTRVTLRDVYSVVTDVQQRVIRVEERLDGLADTSDDHEKRLRDNEKRFQDLESTIAGINTKMKVAVVIAALGSGSAAGVLSQLFGA